MRPRLYRLGLRATKTMPSKSAKQARMMRAAAHNPAFSKKVGVPVSVAQEFSEADKGKKFGLGGRTDRQKINKPKTRHGSMALFKEGGDMAKCKKMASGFFFACRNDLASVEHFFAPIDNVFVFHLSILS